MQDKTNEVSLFSFVEISLFRKRWEEIGLNDDDLRMLQLILLENPEAGVMMQGTGGLRKIRFALQGKGKGGGARVCYVVFAEFEMIYLITAFTKDEQDNLSQEEKNILKKRIKELRDETARRFGSN